MRLYHVAINSMYVEIVRVRFRGPDYWKLWLRYYTKGSNRLIAEERSVKVTNKAFLSWEVYP